MKLNINPAIARWLPTFGKPLLTGMIGAAIVVGVHLAGLPPLKSDMVTAVASPIALAIITAIVQRPAPAQAPPAPAPATFAPVPVPVPAPASPTLADLLGDELQRMITPEAQDAALHALIAALNEPTAPEPAPPS